MVAILRFFGTGCSVTAMISKSGVGALVVAVRSAAVRSTKSTISVSFTRFEAITCSCGGLLDTFRMVFCAFCRKTGK